MTAPWDRKGYAQTRDVAVPSTVSNAHALDDAHPAVVGETVEQEASEPSVVVACLYSLDLTLTGEPREGVWNVMRSANGFDLLATGAKYRNVWAVARLTGERNPMTGRRLFVLLTEWTDTQPRKPEPGVDRWREGEGPR